MANQLKIKVESEHVLTEAVLEGIAVDDVIASYVRPSSGDGNFTYTATKDCFAIVNFNWGNDTGQMTIKLNDVSLFDNYVNSSMRFVSSFPMKAGDKIQAVRYNTVKIYGLKR